MCFYEQQVFACGDFKWGHFRQHCNREYRTGETCGMKLIMATNRLSNKCKLCEKTETKQRRIKAEQDRIRRWEVEPHKYGASIARAMETITQVEGEIRNLAHERNRRAHNM